MEYLKELYSMLVIGVTMHFNYIVASICESKIFPMNKNRPPITVPFDLAKTGETYKFDVRIFEEYRYQLDVQVYYPDKNWLKNKQMSLEQYIKTRDDIIKNFRTSHPINWNMPIKLHVKIVDKKNNEVIRDATIDSLVINSDGTVVSAPLKKGEYEVTINYLDADPRLFPLHVNFYFEQGYRPK